MGPLVGLAPMRHSIFSILPSRPARTTSVAMRKRPAISARCWLPVWRTRPVAATERFFHRQGQRLLTVDVLAVPEGVDGDDRVPVVGCGDDDGIDLRVAGDFTEVVVAGDLVAVLGVLVDGEGAVAGVDVANRVELD